MAQVILHTEDGKPVREQINTTTLALKSIVGHEKQKFNELTAYENNLYYVQENTLDIIRRLSNVINNIYAATEILIGLQTAIYATKGKKAKLNEIMKNPEQEYNKIPESFFNDRGGRL